MAHHLKFLIAILLLTGTCFIGCASKQTASTEASDEQTQNTPTQKPETARDLVCGMDVYTKSPDTLSLQYEGATYYFCSETCKKSFEADPGKYVNSMGAGDAHEGMNKPE